MPRKYEATLGMRIHWASAASQRITHGAHAAVDYAVFLELASTALNQPRQAFIDRYRQRVILAEVAGILLPLVGAQPGIGPAAQLGIALVELVHAGDILVLRQKPLQAIMKQLMEQNLPDVSDTAQLFPEKVNHPVLNGALHPRSSGHAIEESDGAVEYANRGLMRKLTDPIRYLLGDTRFGKPFSLRQWD